MKMTTEAQRIAIAEACGWLLDHINRSAMYYVPSRDCHVGDPLSDLNACHEFEKVLDKMTGIHGPSVGICTGNEVYEDMLLGMCNHPIRATAPQRCEAFLKTLDKWTNDR